MKSGSSKTCVITGASSGIGRELALQLAGEGRELWLIARNPERLRQVADEVRAKGGEAHVVELDLADLDASEVFLHESFPDTKQVDEIYLCAAISLFGEVKDTQGEDWDTLYRVNLLSPVRWSRYFYEAMVKRRCGKIVMVASLAAYAGYPTSVPYATMKAGLLGLYRSLEPEAKNYGVSVHLVSPGYVSTGIFKSAIFRGTNYEKTLKEIRATGFRILSAEETASAIIRGVERRKKEFGIPFYSSAMKWVSPRCPAMLDLIHRMMVKRFRKKS